MSRLCAEFGEAGRRAHRHADAEAIHDLRVASRRLIATLRLWRDLFRAGSRRKAQRRLRSLRRRLGPARELEARVELLDSLARPLDQASRTEFEILLRDSRQCLARARRRASDWVRPRRMRSLIARLQRASGRIDDHLAKLPGVVDRARARRARCARQAIAALETAQARTTDASFHEARIALKKWRYAEEALGAWPESGGPSALDAMRELQDILGVIQDSASLRDAIAPDPTDGVSSDARAPVIDAVEAQRSQAVALCLSVIPAFLRRVSTAVVDSL